MTVRVTTLKGGAAGAYYVEALPNYYLDADEPRGRWLGHGADLLVLSGDVADDAFLALMAGMDPRRPDRHLGRVYDDQSVRGFDVTCSAPKSVSVLFALGDDDVRREVLAAHDAAVAAVARWIERHAHTRYRIGGEVAVVDAEGIVAAAFRQHTSRAIDPQIHTHLVIANRVKSPDGRWLALDARLIKHDQRTLSALYHAGLRAEMTMRLGTRWHQPDNGIAEIREVHPDVLAEFSTRTADVHRRIENKLDRFQQQLGRGPTPRERWCLEREAVVDSRPAKSHSVDAASLHVEWAERARTIGFDPAHLVERAIDRNGASAGIDEREGTVVARAALAALTERQSSWRPTEIQRELGACIPTTSAMPAESLVRWIDRSADSLVEQACADISRPVPAGALLRRDGRPVTESAIDRALSTQPILDQEARVIEWTDRSLTFDPQPQAGLEFDATHLTAPQHHAAEAAAGFDPLVMIVGPAGTGKTTALAAAVHQLHLDDRPVFGLAPSAAAADVLARETGVVADTVDKLLVEHLRRGPRDPQYTLPAYTTVIVDEAGMISTDRLDALVALATRESWRLVLVGDPLQFAAVGRGGMFGLLTDTFGAIGLDAVHRFRTPWERDASLRLRRGEVGVLDVYDAHERIRGGTTTGMQVAAIIEWSKHRGAGRNVLLMAPTNETVDRLNEACQRLRIDLGELHHSGGRARIRSGMALVGDEVVTRHNDRTLRTDRGEMVRNRATWMVERVDADGSIVVSSAHGTVQLPQNYVAEHVELAYATTGMGAQGRTVDHGILYLDRPADVRNVYVAMTRGRQSNTAYVATEGEESAVDVLARCLTSDWIDRPAHVRRAELDPEWDVAPARSAATEIEREWESTPRRSSGIEIDF